MDRGLEILAKVKRELGVPVLTDVHDEAEVAAVAEVVDVLQTRRSCAADRLHPRRGAAAASRSTSRRASSWRRTTHEERDRQGRAPPRERPAEDAFMACRNAAPASATTTSSPTCAAWPSCARPARRWSSTPPTACSCPAARAPAAAASASSCRCWRAPVAVGVAGRLHGNAPRPRQTLSDGPNAVPLKALLEQLLALSGRGQAPALLETIFLLDAPDGYLDRRDEHHRTPERIPAMAARRRSR